jgi:ribonuclease-3
MEAVIGAIYLDGGFAAARSFVLNMFGAALQGAGLSNAGKDPKTRLQEYLQSRRIALPSYSVIATEGEAHRQLFRVECRIAQLSISVHGEGSSRRAAEQEAAQAALELAAQQA